MKCCCGRCWYVHFVLRALFASTPSTKRVLLCRACRHILFYIYIFSHTPPAYGHMCVRSCAHSFAARSRRGRLDFANIVWLGDCAHVSIIHVVYSGKKQAQHFAYSSRQRALLTLKKKTPHKQLSAAYYIWHGYMAHVSEWRRRRNAICIYGAQRPCPCSKSNIAVAPHDSTTRKLTTKKQP